MKNKLNKDLNLIFPDLDDDFIQKSIDNNNLIVIKPEHEFTKESNLDLIKLNNTVYNFYIDKDIIFNKYKNKSGIYLLHNNINGKQYIGSAIDLSKRLATYYFPSRLIDNRFISNSILKYGHENFSVIILYILGDKGLISKINILNKEQECIDKYKPILNLNPKAGSSLNFKHTEESKRLISEFRKGKPLSKETKKKLSTLFSGELNPF